jgi:dTDP-4-dehydrorhamnose 3,5-epimerase-like enzyme
MVTNMPENESIKDITYHYIDNKGGNRGCSFNVPAIAFDFVESIKDMHVATIVPNAIRGNHYHVSRKEFIVVLFEDSWVLGWDHGPETKSEQKKFSGKGAVLVEINSSISHAIKNTGQKKITIIACNSSKYNPQHPDTFKRNVLV